MADDGWGSRSHSEIVKLLGGLTSDAAHAEAKRWENLSQAISDSVDTATQTRANIHEVWTGGAADKAYERVGRLQTAVSGDDGLIAVTGKIGQAAEQDGETLIAASRVPHNYPEPSSGAPTDTKNQALAEIRAEAQRMYTSPLSGGNRPDPTDPQLDPIDQVPGTGTGGGNGTGGGGNGGGGAHDLSKIGQGSGDTKPAFDQGALGDQSGQGAGQGQGSGSGSGAGGSGGGSPSGSGGAGSSLGSALSGLGAGLDKNGPGYGNTAAAGYQPSSGSGSGSGTATAGPRGALGLDHLSSGARGGAGTNPSGVGGAGLRGGVGVGGVGMAGTGAHGRGGKGEDDADEHQIPGYLINWDNGNELFGDLPPASPGVIGDWSEQEHAEKQRAEAEKRRYKSLGWDVKFD